MKSQNLIFLSINCYTLAPVLGLFSPESFRYTILKCNAGRNFIRKGPILFSVPSRKVRKSLDDLKNINNITVKSGQEPLHQSKDLNQVYQCNFKYTKPKVMKGRAFTDDELRLIMLNDLNGETSYVDAREEYGFAKKSHMQYRSKLLQKNCY